MRLTDLLNLANPGIFALINYYEKKVYLGHGKNMLDSIQKLLAQYNKDLSHLPIDRMELKVLEETGDETVRHFRLSYWNDYYLSNGYTMYRPIKPHSYKLYYELKDVSEINNFQYRAFLYLAKNDKKILLGLFKSKEDMDKWKRKYYPNDIVQDYIMVVNKETKDYFRNLKESTSLRRYIKRSRRRTMLNEDE